MVLAPSSTHLSQRTEEVVEVVADKGLVGKQFRKDAKPLMEWLGNLDRTTVEQLEGQLQETGYGVAFKLIALLGLHKNCQVKCSFSFHRKCKLILYIIAASCYTTVILISTHWK